MVYRKAKCSTSSSFTVVTFLRYVEILLVDTLIVTHVHNTFTYCITRTNGAFDASTNNIMCNLMFCVCLFRTVFILNTIFFQLSAAVCL